MHANRGGGAFGGMVAKTPACGGLAADDAYDDGCVDGDDDDDGHDHDDGDDDGDGDANDVDDYGDDGGHGDDRGDVVVVGGGDACDDDDDGDTEFCFGGDAAGASCPTTPIGRIL